MKDLILINILALINILRLINMFLINIYIFKSIYMCLYSNIVKYLAFLIKYFQN